MAMRRSQKWNKSRTNRRISSLRARRQTVRGLRVETLEDRRLLATGPQLVGIQPNTGELLLPGQSRDVAPQELRFLFDSAANIDRASLPTDESNPSPYDSIQVIRSGGDGEFERASVFSDFNTAGAVTIEFEAKAVSQAGNVVGIAVDRADLGSASRAPGIRVQGQLIQITLNTNLNRKTRASDLISAINADTAAGALVTATLRSGSSAVDIATPLVNYSPLTMKPANSASAVSNFNAGSLAIEFVAAQTGLEGNGIAINVTRANLGLNAAPKIAVNGKAIAIQLNSNAQTPTTAQQLLNAFNANAAARALATAVLRAGAGDTLLGTRTINYSPILLSGADDVRIEPGYLDLGDSAREVVMRFKDHLPDDVYMVEILGGGPTPLQNVNGDAFREGANFQMTFQLNQGPQIVAVVPQPVVRVGGTLVQQRNVIEVYFNDDDLNPTVAEDPRYYQLIYTAETVTNADDRSFHPDQVQYDPVTDKAVLTFSAELESLAGAGSYRLRIGTDEATPEAPQEVPVTVDPGSSFDTAMDLTSVDLGAAGALLSSAIRSQLSPLDYPGGNDEPGHRDIDWIETHLYAGGDTAPGIITYYYNFKTEYGFDPQGNVLRNAITDTEKERAREVFDFYSRYLGVNFVESGTRGFTIVTGDLRAVDPGIPTGIGGVIGVAGNNMAVMDLVDFQNPGDDLFGGPWFETAMHEIGHLLGLGHTYDLPPLTIQGDEAALLFGQTAEAVFPGDQDIVHGQYLHRPESNDIDLYRFELNETGLFSAETFAQRKADASLLDTVITLYKATLDESGNEVSRELIARNEDYYNKDSYLEMTLERGTYYVGVSASGNLDYDPAIEDSGAGGRSEGEYQLRLNFRPAADNSLVDKTGQALDGDGDGIPGGVYNFWFRAAAPHNGSATGEPRTIFVDKLNAQSGGSIRGAGTLANPFRYLPDALQAARPGDVVRLLGNPGADGDITTLDDNVAYQIGFNAVNGAPLQDGATLEVPKDVTLVIDANAIVKLRRASIGVGSSSQSLDRSGGAIQVLGTPRLIDASGKVMVDETGQAIAGSVYFTSLHDAAVGLDFDPNTAPPAAAAGDWGGIVFRADLDIADANRLVYAQEGIFLNYVNHAVMTYGGGEVMIGGRAQSVAPLQMIDERPTLTYNTISHSAFVAMSANPDSFEEDNFHAPKYQSTPFTSDYSRVGPEIHHNTLVANSLNGLFIRMTTPAGGATETLTKSARWDDTDITHIVAENLIIQGQAGGPVLETIAPPVAIVTLEAVTGGTLDAGSYQYKIVFVDAGGNEGPASDATRRVEVSAAGGAVVLRNLPRPTAADPYVARRVYRAAAGSGRFELVAQINANDTMFRDNGGSLGSLLQDFPDVIRPRLAGRLAVDPGTIVKLDGARIEATFGAVFISEGVDGRPIVYTSLSDDRYGSGGTFDTNLQGGQRAAQAGDWGGIYLGHLSRGSLDFSIIAFGGGTTRLDGNFAGFNALEIHQAEVRVANSRFEQNANGQGGQAPADRFGRGSNDQSLIFVRGAQPIIVSNTMIDNAGAAISINVNALNHLLQQDTGRTTGAIGIAADVSDNQGPLVRLNSLAGNGTNGMRVRGGTLTTQSVWDDTDIVHVLLDTVVVPDFHTYGGLRLESSPLESLVVKLQGSTAGFTATGRELDITDRIGGSVQIVGQPRFPVYLTSLNDDSVGAGFTPDGLPQNDTNGDGSSVGLLPTGPEVNTGTLIDNDVAAGIPGQFAFDVFNGGSSDFVSRGGISAQGNTQLFVNENVVFEFTNYVDTGAAGGAVDLRATTVTSPATLVDHDRVISEGTFTGQNGLVRWQVETYMNDGESIVYNVLTLTSDQPLGALRFINYLDEDIRGVSDDLLYVSGTPGTNDFRIFTLDGPERVGFSQGGIVEAGAGLANATYDGWTADRFPLLRSNIEGAGTTYSVPGNINTANLPPINDPELGQIYGLSDVTTAMAWSVNPNATQATITSFLELVPRNPASAGQAGDWRSVRLEALSNDRNVDVTTEREPRDTTLGPDSNGQPGSAQYLGQLAPREQAGDETLRLGFEVHGSVSEPDDVDVYSFQAKAGTEVWLDIDRTTASLDSVVELVDANGNIIALSDNSYHEELGTQLLYKNSAAYPDLQVNPLRKSAADFYPESMLGEPKDLWSTNLGDAGMRVVLPGSLETTNTYFVRVRSSNVKPGASRDDLVDPAKVHDGLTRGVYQLQIRLREVDEVPGSTVQYADIRFATNGVELIGLPTHSPLTGEAAEANAGNDSLAAAQALGNLLNSDRGTISVAGSLSGLADVDFYRFDVTFDSIQNIAGFTNPVQHLATILDVDYADGLARANTRITVFDANGNVILHAADSNIADDQPAPLNGTDLDDLSRGSAGTRDPYIGTQELPVGTYYVAVSSDARIPTEFEQFYSPTPANTLFRLEPITSVERIVEDHIGSDNFSTANPPQVPVLFDQSTFVPYALGDVVLFVSTDIGGADNGRLYTIDAFTGAWETTVGDIGRNIGDIAMRQDGLLHSFSVDDTFPVNDEGSGNYLRIDTGNAATTNLGDDAIETWQATTDVPPGEELHDVGYQFHALTYGNPDIYNDGGPTYLFAVGNRFPGRLNTYTENVLYRFNADTGEAVSLFQDREGIGNPGGARFLGAGTQIVERGFLDTSADPLGTADTQLLLVEATVVNDVTGATTFQIPDGLLFSIDDDGNPATAPIVFEFNAGPEIRLTPNPVAGAYARDGDFFQIGADIFEFDTGSVIVLDATSGNDIADGATFTITDDAAVSYTFEYNKTGGVTPGNIPITINNGMSTAVLVSRTVSAINGVPGFGIRAEAIAGSNRITLRGESLATGAISTSPAIMIEGAPGGSGNYVIPIEETSSLTEYGNALVTTFQDVPGVTVGWDGQRVNFSGATTGDFSIMEASGVFVDMGSDGFAPNGFPINFLAEDTGEDLAVRARAAINSLLSPIVTATVSNRTVTISGGTFAAADNPLRIAGAAPGGLITGIAFVGNTMYAVSDNGGLFRITNPGGRGAQAVYIPTSAEDLLGIDFQALTAGPVATADGGFAQMLFAMDRSGELYAFNTLGELQPVFVNGQTSINTGVGAITGMAFSTLEENPWGIVAGTDARGDDPGHGQSTTFDQSRYSPAYPTQGGASLHFGRTEVSDYNWPGGAHGSMESKSFSLAGYSPNDKPVLYFNYFAETQGESSDPATQTPMLDSIRVFMSNETGGWDLLTTNNSYAPHELNYSPNSVQEIYDNNTGWRQVRVELDNYAGRDNLQLRIDFSTAGSMNVGNINTTGSELRVVSGAQLRDGQTLSIGDVTFEIEMGYTLVAPTGGAIRDGDTFRVEDAALNNITFEFTQTGTVSDPLHVPVSYHGAMTAQEVALAMEAAMRAELDPSFLALVVGNRINIPDAVSADAAGSAVALSGGPGSSGVPIFVNAAMTSAQVAEAVQEALAGEFAGGVREAFSIYHDNVVRVIGHRVANAGPFGLTSSLPGDNLGGFNSNLRGQNNAFEGVYLDDFIIGFAERGEIATNASGNNTFYANPELPASQILSGAYQLEIRQAEKYGQSLQNPAPRLRLVESFDTNDRLTQSFSFVAPSASEISDGQTFTVSDGVRTITFEFDDARVNNGVEPGHVEISFNPARFDFITGDVRPETAAEMAARIRDAINSPSVQAELGITAALADGTVNGVTTSTVINLFGNVETSVIDAKLRVTQTTTDANALRDAILGNIFQPVGDATFVGSSTSAGFFTGGSSSIGIASGIVLTTGDARYVEGPNQDDGSSGFASEAGDPDLDAFFAPFETLDSTVLEFSFLVEEDGTDLFFEFVFSSEEYNEFVDSFYNDVFGFFVDGENIAFVPGTVDPVSINSVNGGNPYGSGGTNAFAYNNNDRDDGGRFLDTFGHDGFTSVFVARRDNLTAGEHTIKLAISDVGDSILDSAVFIRAFNATAPDPRTSLPGIVYENQGDQNLRRDQGQVVIHSSTISNSAQYGVRVEPSPRDATGQPTSGPVRVTRHVNDLNLVTGVVISNNVLANNSAGGIYFAGDTVTSGIVAPVPFGRVVNNTIVGGNAGITVRNNASPTLLNNIVADVTTGISIDASSSSTVVGGTLYAGVGQASSTGNVGSFPLFMSSSTGLFMNKDLGNYYPAPGALAIDSSVESLGDRSAMTTLRRPLGIADSPIVAPDLDLLGQLRTDDTSVASPTGLGGNVFKDRGAIDRADFAGPSAVFVSPRDNDAAGIDNDSRATYLEVPNQSLFQFSIQLLDGIAPSDQSNGSGPDASTVTARSIVVTKDEELLEEGVDYRFGYDATSGIIRLTPLAGIWEPDRVYTIELLNQDNLVLSARAGDVVADGTTFTVTDLAGTAVTFEYDSGYSLQVPAGGGASIRDGETFRITQGLVTRSFEFDLNNVSSPANVKVRINATDTADQVAEAVAAAISGAGLGLSATAWTNGFVHVGGDKDTVLTTTGSSLTRAGQPGVTAGNVAVPYVAHEEFTNEDMAVAIATAIQGSALNVAAEARLGEVVLVGAASAAGITNTRILAIRDLAGNVIQPNRNDGTTTFTVSLGAGRDYGDAPSQYPVLKADNGASHEIVMGFQLGAAVFSSADGVPTPNADGDLGDDGVVFGEMTSGFQATVTVTAAGITLDRPGRLDAWIDFNGDGDWDDSGEQIFPSVALVNGVNSLEFTVSASAVVGDTFARFRLSSDGGLTPQGAADDGEVEDYRITIAGNPWRNHSQPLSTSGDAVVSPIDALFVIHLLNNLEAKGNEIGGQAGEDLKDGKLPVPPIPGVFEPAPYYDVDGDGYVAPLDALLIITHLNSLGAGEGEGSSDGGAEGEAEPAALAAGGVDVVVSDAAGVRGAALVVTATAARPEAEDDGAVSNRVSEPTLVLLNPGFPGSEPQALVNGVDFRESDLEDLLDALTGESDEVASLDVAHDAFFATF